MSVNGWIKILSIIFKVDVSKRLDAVAIDYDALNDVLGALDSREVRVLQMTIDEGKTLKSAGDKVCASPERIRQLKNKALRKLKHPMRVSMLRRAISGWWHLAGKSIHTPATPKTRSDGVATTAESTSCLVITNFNKPVVRVETKSVEVRVEKPVTYFREPMWHSVKDLLPTHDGIVVVRDFNSHDQLLWFATFKSDSMEFIYANATTSLLVTHWCELPRVVGSPYQGWDRRLGRYVSLPESHYQRSH
jgi:DNA-binding CsgD family transcriptional regulator